MYKRKVRHYVNKKKRNRIYAQEDKRYVKYTMINNDGNKEEIRLLKSSLINANAGINKNKRQYSSVLLAKTLLRIVATEFCKKEYNFNSEENYKCIKEK